jgi:hypothetical protein
MKDYKIRLSEAKVQFTQDGNTLGSTDDAEILDISFENQLPGDETFMVLRSSTGWSMHSASDLVSILDVAHKAIDGLREFEV